MKSPIIMTQDEAKLWEGIREVEQREWEEAQRKIEEDTLALAIMPVASSAEHLIATKARRLHSYGLDAHCR